MAYIKVNISKLESTASAIEEHISYAKSLMTSQNTDVTALFQNWNGRDADEFRNRYFSLVNDTSAFNAYIKSLQSYADFLRA